MTNINRIFKITLNITFPALAMLTGLGCSTAQSEEPTANAKDVSANQTVEETSPSKLQIREQIEISKTDLATRLGLELDAVSLSGATPVSWRSTALGCPKPGNSYMDVLVPGMWIVLKVENKAYRYHAIAGGEPFYCPDDRAEPPVMGSRAD